MKHVFWSLLLALFVAVGCNQDKGGSGKVVVKGQLANGEGEMIKLSIADGNNPKALDSVALSADGSFKLETEINTPRFLYLGQLDKGNFIQIIGKPGETVSIDGQFQEMGQNFKVEGSAATQELKELSDKRMAIQQKLQGIQAEYSQKTSAEKDEAKVAALEEEKNVKLQEIYDAYIAESKAFIDGNPGSLAAIVALSDLKPEQEFAYYEKVDSGLMANYPDNPQVKQFHGFVENRKQQMDAMAEQQKKLEVGATPPDFTLQTIEGETLTLSDLKGNYVLLDFWASWCQPCRKENPNLVDNYKKYSDDGFEILQVSVDKDAEKWKAAIKEDGLGAWSHVHDNSNKVSQMYQIQYIPTSYLLNKDGEIIAKNLRGNALSTKLEELMGS